MFRPQLLRAQLPKLAEGLANGFNEGVKTGGGGGEGRGRGGEEEVNFKLSPK
jgi:hypothetical protein